jgi:hypothetical protein
LGKLAELRDSGILFISSWGIMICGWKIISEGIEHSVFMTIKNTFGEKTFLIGHGDGKVLESRVQTHEKSVYQSVFKWLLDGYILILA